MNLSYKKFWIVNYCELKAICFLFFKKISIHKFYIFYQRIGIVSVADSIRSDRNKWKRAMEEVSRIEDVGIAVIILDERKWQTLKAFEKSAILYSKIVELMDVDSGLSIGKQ